MTHPTPHPTPRPLPTLPECPNCHHVGGAWTIRLLHDDERAVECPSCGTVLTEQYLRDVLGVTLPPTP